MVRMSALASALSFRRLVDSSATLRMLRADHVAVMAAILGEHLGAPGARIDTVDLHELVDDDLFELRDHFDLSGRSAKAYCDDWRGAGILIRRPATDSRGETYELSAAGFDALRILEQLEEPQTTVTESRLVALATSLHQLAIDTDPDTGRRLRALESQRRRIDAEIARIRKGDAKARVLGGKRAKERVIDVLNQAQGMPADFARVRARFEELNHELRTRILEADELHGSVLDEVFHGMDLIEDSEEGRTFAAFSSFVRDPEQSAAFEEDISAILSRDFAQDLPLRSRQALRSLMRDMKDGSRVVQGVLTEFARGLRRYVHSHEYMSDRAMRSLLQEALAQAVPARLEVRPFTPVGEEMELSSMRMSSVGALILHDPADFDTGQTLDEAEAVTVDFAALSAIARESEIDFDELTDNVNAVLGDGGGSPASVAEVLEHHPATQGVASVIGLISLAATQGEIDMDAAEELSWHGTDGVLRRAVVQRHVFTKEVDV
jgi:hypothetical protein